MGLAWREGKHSVSKISKYLKPCQPKTEKKENRWIKKELQIVKNKRKAHILMMWGAHFPRGGVCYLHSSELCLIGCPLNQECPLWVCSVGLGQHWELLQGIPVWGRQLVFEEVTFLHLGSLRHLWGRKQETVPSPWGLKKSLASHGS